MCFLQVWIQFNKDWKKYNNFQQDLIQEGHDGPEITHLYIGLRGRANFNPEAFIWTNLVDNHLKMFHDKYLSSSSKKIF
jgi:hypothetical protein